MCPQKLKLLLKKRQTSLDASRKKVSRTLRRASPILPFPGSNTPAETSNLGFQNQYITRNGLNMNSPNTTDALVKVSDSPKEGVQPIRRAEMPGPQSANPTAGRLCTVG